ncbi:MAG TPA: AAA family ATPase [Rhodocyclaceae bacterium]|nr:AAA family ATPase [Rhodocyclaceae bacterium]
MSGDLERIRDALHYIPASDRDTWVGMGMAIKSELGDTGFDMWEAWSQQDESFDPSAARDVWKSIRAGGKVTAGTLFYEAKARGWRDDGTHQRPTQEELAERRREAAERADKEQAEDAKRKADAAAKAATIWAALATPADQAYLKANDIQAHGIRQHNDALVIPMRTSDGVLHSLQFIGPDGGKKFLTGGRVSGCYHAIGDPKGAAALCIAEGYATGATIHEATGYPVAIAFTAGNLLAVARAMREKFPDLTLILCADDDVATAGNPGLTKATEAARSVGGLLAVPDFGTDRPDGATDFNDVRRHCGAEAIKRAIARASAPAMPEHQPETESAPAGEYASRVELVRASDVTPEAVTWLWPGWLAAGKMHVLGGAPGTGKTTISMALAATVTTGGRWPDGSKSPVGNVLIWSGEDDPSDTLVPRLALSGADLSRVYFVAEVREGNDRRSFDPARDMEPLRREVIKVGDVRLLIVDPIVSAIAGDSHKNAEVRRGLQPLADLAASIRCAMLGITHFSKGTGGRDPVERLTGSLAFGALPRIVMVAAKHQEEGEDGRTVRIFIRAKSNIGPDDGGFEYDLHQGEMKSHPGIFSSSVLWGEAVEGAARELLATADTASDDGEGGTLADAKSFLTDLLADGPLPVKAIKADADGAGYSWASIRRAQKAIGAEAIKEGMKGGWMWSISRRCSKNPEDAQQNNVSTFGQFEHLRATGDVIEVDI